MTEQTAQDQSRPAAASVLSPDTLHIYLPNADPDDVSFHIDKCLIQMTSQHCVLITEGFVTCAMINLLASSCIDIIQTFAQAILDVVLPQVLRYMRIYGTFSPTILGLTEDRIHTYLGDSVEQALANFLKIEVQDSMATKRFSQLLLGNISNTVNSVLALFTQTPNPESRLPVLFVSGCKTSIRDLRDMVCYIAVLLMKALRAQQSAQRSTEVQYSQTELSKPSEEVDSLVFCINSKNYLKQVVKAYIIRMVKVFKSKTQIPRCDAISRNHRDVCIRVGTNTLILTVEDSEADRQKSAPSSSSGLDALPGALPDREDTNYDSERCPFNSITVIGTMEEHSHHLGSYEMESIENIAHELVQAFLEDDLQGSAQADSSQRDGWLDVVDNVKLGEFTDRIFALVMHGRDYQMQLLPFGTRMCDTVTYGKLRREDISDSGIAAQALYMRTEEVVARCAVQVLLWSSLYPDGSDYPSPLTSDELSDEPDYVIVQRHAGGDCTEVLNGTPSSPLHNSAMLSQESGDTYDVSSEASEPTKSQLLAGIAHTSLLTLLVGQMLTAIGIRSSNLIFEMVRTAIDQLQDVDPKVYDYFYASLMGHSYKDMYQTAISDLLLEFGSIQAMQEVLRSGDPRFEEAFLRALRKHLVVPLPPVRHGETTFSFFKKFKRLHCKQTKKADKATTVISLARDHDDDNLRKESLKDQTEHCQCAFMSRIGASTRNMCSSTRKMFSSFAKTLERPFVACCGPESQ